MRKRILFILSCVFLFSPGHTDEIGNTSEELANASPEYIENIYQLALMEFDKRNYEESLKYIRHVIKSGMTNYKLRYLAAHDHWKLGHFDLATAHFQVAIFSKPQNPEGYMDLALMKIHERDYGSAERALISGLYTLQMAKMPVPARYYNIYSRLQLMIGFPLESLKYAELAKAAFAQSGTGIKDKLETMTLEARSHLLLDNYEKAELAMQWAVAMRKNNVYAYNLLGYVYAKWYEKVEGLDQIKAKEYKAAALENYKLAKNTDGVIEEFKDIINSNIDHLK